MNRTIVIAVLMINFLTVGCAEFGKYVEPIFEARRHADHSYAGTRPTYGTETRATYVTDGPIVLDRINEEAFIEYRDSLRDAVQLISVLSNPQMANPYFVTQIHTQLSTSIIEIQQWPADLRGTGWRTMGGEIESLSNLFDSHRQRLISDERYAADFRSELARIELLARE